MDMIRSKHYDVIVVGGGSAGIAAAIAASKKGLNTLLVEANSMIGSDMISGLPLDGLINARGEWIVKGLAKELIDMCTEMGGFAKPLFDWRLIWAVCIDPEFLKIAIVEMLKKYNVSMLLHTFAVDVILDNNKVTGICLVNKSGKMVATADVFIDCTGDGDICSYAGIDFEKGNQEGEFQPVSLVFRMCNVDYNQYLDFIRDNPQRFILGESPVIDKSREECALEIYKSGYPFAGLTAEDELLKNAIQDGRMYACTGIYTYPTSIYRNEIGVNSTRIANVDATNTQDLTNSLYTLTEQIKMCMDFLQQNIPGFKRSYLSGVANHIGVRETRRIKGEYVLSADDVLEGRRFSDVIAKGGHHIDIHGSGKYQKRIPVKDGKSYDIPFRCLIPLKIENILIAGRCLSSTREANGSARVMGQCMATGEAAGTAAAIYVFNSLKDVRDIPMKDLQMALRKENVVLD